MDMNMDVVESVFAVIGGGFTVAFIAYWCNRLWESYVSRSEEIQEIKDSICNLEIRIDMLSSDINTVSSDVELLTDDMNTELDSLRSKKR